MPRAARPQISNFLSRLLDVINKQPLHPGDDALGGIASFVTLIRYLLQVGEQRSYLLLKLGHIFTNRGSAELTLIRKVTV